MLVPQARASSLSEPAEAGAAERTPRCPGQHQAGQHYQHQADPPQQRRGRAVQEPETQIHRHRRRSHPSSLFTFKLNVCNCIIQEGGLHFFFLVPLYL